MTVVNLLRGGHFGCYLRMGLFGASLQGGRLAGRKSIAPGRFHQHAPHVGVARLGNRPPLLTGDAGMLAGDQTDKGHQLARRVKAGEVPQLGQGRDGRERVYPAQRPHSPRLPFQRPSLQGLLQRRGAYPPPPGAREILGLEFSGLVDVPGTGCQRSSRAPKSAPFSRAGICRGGRGARPAGSAHSARDLPAPGRRSSEGFRDRLPESFLGGRSAAFRTGFAACGGQWCWHGRHSPRRGPGTRGSQRNRRQGGARGSIDDRVPPVTFTHFNKAGKS